MPQELPHGITLIQRSYWVPKWIGLLLGIVIFGLLLKSHLIIDINSLSHKGSNLDIVFLLIYITVSFSCIDSVKTWVFKRLGGVRPENFIKEARGLRTTPRIVSWPTRQIYPAGVTIIALCAPIIIISVIPGLFFSIIGWGPGEFWAEIVYLFNLDYILSAVYYLPFWRQNVIEFIEINEANSIKTFIIYFFPNTDEATEYIKKVSNDFNKIPLPKDYLI